MLDNISDDGAIDINCEKLVMEELKNHFRPEFLNRLDEIIMFSPLSRNNIKDIIDLLVVDINKRIANKEISLEVTDNAKEYILDNAYDPVYGARPLKRYLQKYIETLAAKMILEDKVKQEDVIVIDSSNNGLISYIKE